MYDGIKVDGTEVTDILRDVLGFRYQLIPTMYSLYVNEYWKRGWPVLRVSSLILDGRVTVRINWFYFSL